MTASTPPTLDPQAAARWAALTPAEGAAPWLHEEVARRMAERLPAGHATVYRIISGETQRPARAVKAAIERVVEEGRTEEGQEKQL